MTNLKVKHVFLGEDDMEETGGQISNVGQQVDGSSDAEESQRLVSYIFYSFVNSLIISLITLLIIHSYKRYMLLFYFCDLNNDLNILVFGLQKSKHKYYFS